MITPKLDILASLKMAGINKDDIVMIHADAGVAAQIKYPNNNKLQTIINQLIEYFYDSGTLIVPTFSYSITENEIFNKNKSRSKVGLFSEKFLLTPSVIRTNHPMFSFGLIGKNLSKYVNCTNNDCFGSNTIFDLFM